MQQDQRAPQDRCVPRNAASTETPAHGPVQGPPGQAGMSPVLARNIQSLADRRRREQRAATIAHRAADAITRFAGSMTFVAAHLVIVALWVPANLGWLPGIPRWDASFVILGTAASVEAIFLSTFVLISQNRMAAEATKRADLDLQVSLLAEHEVTKLVALVSSIAGHLGVHSPVDSELGEIEQDVAPEAVLDELSAREDVGSDRSDV